MSIQQAKKWSKKWSFVLVVVVAIMIAIGAKNWEVLIGKVMGGSEASADHNDDSRSVVGWTAFLVAMCRAGESTRAAADDDGPPRLLHDPVAERIFSFWDGSAPFSARLAFALLPIVSQLDLFQRAIPLVSLRTFFLDEQIQQGLRDQFVVIGAGLDSRVFRLANIMHETQTFELDFPGMLAEKRRLFGAVGYHYTTGTGTGTGTVADNVIDTTNTIQIGVNLITDDWDEKLIQNGFDPSKPTLWLLEGFLPYLEDSEVEVILHKLSRLSAPSSRILGTWITDSSTKSKLSFHKGFVKDPTKLLARFDFQKEIQVQKLDDVAQRTKRFVGNKQMSGEYLMTCHEKPAL